MSRPCQQRRASAAANRKSKAKANPKPAQPPPIRHKARQKAIHNARRGRGGRPQNSGGRPSRNQQNRDELEQDFISLNTGNGNNFHVLHRAGRGGRRNPIALDDVSDSDDSDDMDDSDMQDAEDISINVDMAQPVPRRRGNAPQAQVMFSVPEAVAIYDQHLVANFPLAAMTLRVRYELFHVDITPSSGPDPSTTASSISRQPSVSSATSAGAMPVPEIHNPAPTSDVLHPGQDYIFDWGAYKGKHFTDVPDDYLKMIGGQLYRYMAKRVGLKDAFEFYRPGQARLVKTNATQANLPQTQSQQPQPLAQKPPSGPRQNKQPNASSISDYYKFPKGIHKGERLHDVKEDYIRTLEGMQNVIDTWPGLRRALEDFNKKTGRKGRV